ncbi:hypothetical protein, partial [Bacillus thuringiensis]|uniref:hypothetical protein n=1 Tax=Bacillus thuringiensis TaxID=1428 RepID=UPI001C5504BE
ATIKNTEEHSKRKSTNENMMKNGKKESAITIPPLKYFIKNCSKGHRRRGLTVRFFSILRT